MPKSDLVQLHNTSVVDTKKNKYSKSFIPLPPFEKEEEEVTHMSCSLRIVAVTVTCKNVL